MPNSVVSAPTRAVLASTSWDGANVQTSRVNVVDGQPATLVAATRGDKKTFALYDDFGQLKATLPQSYATIPTLKFVPEGQFPGAKGVTVEILDDARPTPSRR